MLQLGADEWDFLRSQTVTLSSGCGGLADTPLSIGEIAQRIHVIRGQRVVLDTDLAAFYGETT